MLQLITNDDIALHVPRLLGVYPVVSYSLQLRDFTNTWKNHGSVKQLQVAMAGIQTYTQLVTLSSYRVQPTFMTPSKSYLIV